MQLNPRVLNAFAALAICVLTGCGGGNSASADGQSNPQSAPKESVASTAVNSAVPLVPLAEPPGNVKSRSATARPTASVVRLGRPTTEMKSSQPATPGRMQIGLPRAVSTATAQSALAPSSAWERRVGDVRVSAVSFVSEGAVGLRVGMTVKRIPQNATIRVYAQTSNSMIELPAREILATVFKNIDANGDNDEARTYWFPSVDGEECTIEIEVPNALELTDLDVSFPKVSHYFQSWNTEQSASAACEVDVNCSSGYSGEQSSVAKMEFVEDGSSYLCTGTLMNDRRSTFTPYFLTANHCISTQVVASSLTTRWFYKSATCGSTVLSSATKTVTGGATLLYASEMTDTSFLRLNGAAPAGAQYSGWDPGTPPTSQSIAAIHHPHGDLQKYSEGSVVSYQNCTVGESFSCTPGTSASPFLSVTWSLGTVESGSSGSALFKRGTSGHQVIGQLRGGSASCTSTTGKSYYGRFDVAYNAGLKNWLEAAARDPVYRFYNGSADAHFYTISAAERDRVISTLSSIYSYEGPVFYGYKAADAFNAPAVVTRFYNKNSNSHFYTISPQEVSNVLATLSYMIPEGPAWYANTGPVDTSIPLYRFYNRSSSGHFYTASLAERNYIMANLSSLYYYEGAGYYVWRN